MTHDKNLRKYITRHNFKLVEKDICLKRLIFTQEKGRPSIYMIIFIILIFFYKYYIDIDWLTNKDFLMEKWESTWGSGGDQAVEGGLKGKKRDTGDTKLERESDGSSEKSHVSFRDKLLGGKCFCR